MNTCSPVTGRRALGVLLATIATPALALGPVRPKLAIATVGMVGDVVRDIAGERLRTEVLIGEGVDPHLFRPTRSDISRLLAADIVFGNGHRLEGRMGEVLDRARTGNKPVILIAESLPRERLRAHPEYPDVADPHVWMAPDLWSLAAGVIPEGLARIVPDGRPGFDANLATLRQRLARLDTYARDAVATIPAERRVLVTAHDAFGYFGARTGMEVESIQGLSTEAEANLARIEALVRLLVTRRIPAVFAETSVPDRAVLALIEGAAARGHQVRLGGNLFSDSMGRAGTYTGTYEGMIDHNVTTIVRALGGSAPAGGLNGRLAG